MRPSSHDLDSRICVTQVPVNKLLVKNVSLLGLYWGAYGMVCCSPITLPSNCAQRNPLVLAGSIDESLSAAEQGRIHPHVSKVFPLAQVCCLLILAVNSSERPIPSHSIPSHPSAGERGLGLHLVAPVHWKSAA